MTLGMTFGVALKVVKDSLDRVALLTPHWTMTNMRLLSILVLLLLVSPIESTKMKAGRRRRKNLRARKKAEAKKKAIGTIGETPGCGTGKALDVANATKTAETNEETPLTGADPVDGTAAPVGVIPLGGGGSRSNRIR